MNRTETGVVLFQLGGPDTLDAVEPFLFNLFCDPDIIDIPGAFLFRRWLARLISSRRAPKVRELYRRIGGGSPILAQTLRQANALERKLVAMGIPLKVYVAMRYWHPMSVETLQKVRADGIRKLVLLPLYPHYSKATTGSSFREWNRVMNAGGMERLPGKLVESYFDHPLYIDAIIQNVRTAIDRVPAEDRSKIHLLFSAHGTPMKLVRDGDPYSHQIQRTVQLVVEKGRFGLPHHLCYQSKVGPQRWLEPKLTETIGSLGAEQVSHLIVVPIAFVTEHIETLSEINIEARELAMEAGIRYFDMMPALIDNEQFIACLADLAVQQLDERND